MVAWPNVPSKSRRRLVAAERSRCCCSMVSSDRIGIGWLLCSGGIVGDDDVVGGQVGVQEAGDHHREGGAGELGGDEGGGRGWSDPGERVTERAGDRDGGVGEGGGGREPVGG